MSGNGIASVSRTSSEARAISEATGGRGSGSPVGAASDKLLRLGERLTVAPGSGNNSA